MADDKVADEDEMRIETEENGPDETAEYEEEEVKNNGAVAAKSKSRSRSSSSSKSRKRSRSRRGSLKKRHRRKHSRSPKSRSRSRSRKRSRRRKSRSSSSSRSRSVSRSRSRSRRRHGRRRSRSRSRSRSRDFRRHSRNSGSRFFGPRDCPPPSRCLGIFGMNVNTTESTLAHYFQPYGKIDKIQIIYDAKSGRSRGFAFIYFDSTHDALDAKEQTNGLEIDGYRIRVDFSLTQRPHTPTPGIYMGKPTSRDEFYRGRRYGGGGGRSPSPYRRRSRSRSYSDH